MQRTIIIDDERGARNTLEGMLNQFCDKVQLVGYASNADEARALIMDKKPDLVFLDVRMPMESGFDLLNSLKLIDFKIIFTTAHNDYTLKAIKFSAIDYLLKPINVDELITAVDKAEQTVVNFEQYSVLLSHQNMCVEERIVVPIKGGFKVVNSREILRFEGERNYSWVYLVNGEKSLVSKTLKEFEELLTPYGFLRVHQSHLINLKCVRSCQTGRNATITLVDGSIVALSRQRKQDFLHYFGGSFVK